MQDTQSPFLWYNVRESNKPWGDVVSQSGCLQTALPDDTDIGRKPATERTRSVREVHTAL